MFRKILVANRGEIALRIIRSAKEMGIKTVAIYSEADKESLHVQFADEAYCVGPAEQSKSYLNIPNIISSAIVSGADAIHPGYGFFAENAEFAEVCSDNGFRFIGPSKEAIALLGDKAQAKNLMQEAGVPVIPGSPGCICSLEEAMAFAREVGYPVIVKAAQGGGGRGMRVARNEGELKKAYDLARTEAEKAFESGEVYLEKYVENPRHIEVQILIDELGNGIYLGKRSVPCREGTKKYWRSRLLWQCRRNSGRRWAKLQCGRAGCRIYQCGNHGVSSRLPRELLLYGDEHPYPGGASGDRDGDRRRPHQRADKNRRRSASFSEAGRCCD